MHYQRATSGILDMRPGKLTRLGQGLGRKLPPWKPNDPRYKNKGRLCEVPGCMNHFYANGLCKRHYNYKRRKGFLASRIHNLPPNCIIQNCNKKPRGLHGLCDTHYERKLKGTDLNRPIGTKGELNCRWNGGTSQYLNHYEMKKIRKEVLKEENYTCFMCGYPTKQIHHLDGTKSNHARSNLRACCNSCNLRLTPKHRSKYRRAYGKNLQELSSQLRIGIPKIIAKHRDGTLRELLHLDEIQAILF
jgi:hypothetical protein